MSNSNSRQNLEKYPRDILTTKDGSQLIITFFKHASLALEINGEHIYIDPADGFADYEHLPKADVILITHSHSDHLDRKAIAKIYQLSTDIICDKSSATDLEYKHTILTPGANAALRGYIELETVAAYNTSEGHLNFHPKDRQDNGYVISVGGTNIYIAGDTEMTKEMLALKSIDILFLPVNQPYTMTVDQAIKTVKVLNPSIFYPYHYGEVEEKTDTNRLVNELQGITEVRIRPME